MSGKYDAVDLANIPAPRVIEEISYEQILSEMKADLERRDPKFTALFLESDPATKVLEVCAFREMHIRQRVNDAARATMLAHATGADLDNLAALVKIGRQVVDPGNPDAIPPVAPTMETDEKLRLRAQLAMEGLSTAGPDGAYVFHAVNADPRVVNVDVTSPAPGQVQVTVLSSDNNGVAGRELLDVVDAALNDKDTRPLTDRVSVQAGAKIDYAVVAEIFVYDGPDSTVVLRNSTDSVNTFTTRQKRLGEPVTIDGLHKALRVEGVQRVSLKNPAADIVPDNVSFAHCTKTTVTIGGAAV